LSLSSINCLQGALALEKTEVEAGEPGISALEGPMMEAERIATRFASPGMSLMEGAARAVGEFGRPIALEALSLSDGGAHAGAAAASSAANSS
jgi:hypothetical protein